jgi:magnesium-transporting ATPase (P-type)
VEADVAERTPNDALHAEAAEVVLRRLGAAPDGLTAAAAAERLRAHGPNVIARAAADGPLRILLRQVREPLVTVLVGAAALAMAFGKPTDGAVVLAVVALNALIGFVQEYRAGKAIEALTRMVPETATVLRDGVRCVVPAADVVPGDVVALASGDEVPADARVLGVRGLRVDESALTGESQPVAKTTDAVAAEAALGDRTGMVFGGTLVTSGTATAVVTATGATTELGRISMLLDTAEALETPLTRAMAAVGRTLTVGILVVAAGLLVAGVVRGWPLVDAVLAAITLAVAAIPEGLPAIVTIALAVGVQRMARRRAVVRRLPAVETLGSTTVICSDKTGTLTRNEMTVQRLRTRDDDVEVGGTGYAPEGALHRGGVEAAASPAVRELVHCGLLCSDAALERAPDGWRIAGDPTEGALVVVAAKLGFHADAERAAHPRLDAVPFESERQFMATLHRTPAGAVVLVKGAPEVVLTGCDTWADGTPLDRAAVQAAVDDLAADGLRVLAFATRTVPGATTRLVDDEVCRGLGLLGLQGMMDPPRPEAVDAVARCHAAGITVKMITGDHVGTARAVGVRLGLLDPGDVAVTGTELERTDDDALPALARRANVFARVAPEHKLRLVRALQRGGAVVAMTGDGVNDAPALEQADIGVAMGITGTAVSKEAADVVLADDHFATIAAAVEEGRRIWDNLVKALCFVLPTNLGEALVILVAVLCFPLVDGQPLLPMAPVQILWVNLVATVTLALPLAFEAMEPGLMRRPPRDPGVPVLSRFVLGRTVLVAVLMAAGAIGLFGWEYGTETARGTPAGVALREAQTMAVTTVVLFQVFYVLHCRALEAGLLRTGLWTNPLVYLGIAVLLALQAAFVWAPPMHALFGSAPLDADALTKSAAVALVVLPVVSAEKWWRGRRRRGGGPRPAPTAAPLSAAA